MPNQIDRFPHGDYDDLDPGDMDELISNLAEARRIEAEYAEELAELEAEIESLIKERYDSALRRVLLRREAARKVASRAESLIRSAAVAEYEATQDKHPHPAVTVKVFTTLEYEPGAALDYCREHLPKALKLDRRAFEKVARVSEPEFVTFVVQPRATIARDLRAYETAEGDEALTTQGQEA